MSNTRDSIEEAIHSVVKDFQEQSDDGYYVDLQDELGVRLESLEEENVLNSFYIETEALPGDEDYTIEIYVQEPGDTGYALYLLEFNSGKVFLNETELDLS